jgi:hypothetical protein
MNQSDLLQKQVAVMEKQNDVKKKLKRAFTRIDEGSFEYIKLIIINRPLRNS